MSLHEACRCGDKKVVRRSFVAVADVVGNRYLCTKIFQSSINFITQQHSHDFRYDKDWFGNDPHWP